MEGAWFKSTRAWDELLQPRIEAALAGRVRDTALYQPPYIYTTPSRTAVGAKPVMTPKN